MRELRITAMLVAISGLVSCASSPDPKLYKLPDDHSPIQTRGQIGLISLSELEMPAYARNLQITTAVSSIQLKEDDQHRWAAPPTELFTSAFAQHLEQVISEVVLVRPLPPGIRSDFAIEVEFDALFRTEAGGAYTRGQFILIGQDKSNLTRRFEFDVASNSMRYEDYALALNEALRLLADEIAESLGELARSTKADAA